MRDLTHLAGRIFNTPLAIWRPKMDAILCVLAPRLGLAETPTVELKMLDTQRNERKPYAMTGDGIACIDVEGTLVRKATGMDAWSGLTSYQQIESEWTMAMEDQAVEGILVCLDSPGGEVGGLFDLVDKLYSLRGTKPVYAAVAEQACSAAYAIASVCDKIFVTQTGCVGSIGVWALHVDQSQYDKQLGVKYTYIFAGDRKVDGNPHEPLSKEAKGDFQDEIDRTRGLFVDSVARNRNMSAKKVAATEAGVFFGPEGVAEGLADQVGTPDDAVAALVAVIGGPGAKGSKGKKATAAMPVAELPAVPAPEAAAAAAGTMPMQAGSSLNGATDASAAELNKEASMVKENADAKKNGDEQDVKGKKADDGDTDDGEDDSKKKNDDDNEPESKKGKKKGGDMEEGKNCARTAEQRQADIVKIKQLCALAGVEDKVALEFIEKNASVDDVHKALVDHRAQKSSNSVVFTRHGFDGGRNFAALQTQANEYARSKGVTREQAVATMLAGNPKAYEEFRDQQKQAVMLAQMGQLDMSQWANFQRPGIVGLTPTQYDVHVNTPLTDISVAFIQKEDAFVAVDVFPNVPVLKQSDLYYTYTRADFNTVKFQQRNEDGSSARAGFRVNANSSYLCIIQALGKDIPDTVRANMDSVLSADRDATIWLTQQYLLKRELDFVSQYMVSGAWTNSASGGATATGTLGAAGSTVIYWDNNASTPIEDVRNASRAMQLSSGGFRPTDLTLGRSVFDHLLDHPDIIDRVKYTGTQGSPAKGTKEILAELFEVDRVNVMNAVYNTAADGQPESNSLIGGKNALLTYRPAVPSIMTPSAGYTFSWTGLFGMGPMGTRIKTFREEPKSKDVVEMEAAYAMKLVSADLGFFFGNVTQS